MSQDSPRILIVADDLTGGNACGALFAEAGLRTITVTGTSQSAKVNLDDLLDDYDAVVLNADSRHQPPEKAAELTESLIGITSDIDLVACRIDTTLRGNVGPTAEAALRARRNLTSGTGPGRVMGLCIPAFPASGRVTVGGRQLLNGRLLEDTELRNDVRSPMRTSVVADIVQENTDLQCHTVELSTVLAGHDAIRSDVIAAVAAGADVIVADALNNEHIDLVARAVVDIGREETIDWVCIDPGPGSLALARALLPPRKTGAIFGVSGSATEITRTQLAKLNEDPTITVVRAALDADDLPDVRATIERVRTAASARAGESQADAVRAVIVATVVDAADLLELTDEQSESIPRRLAQITAEVMASTAVTGLYTTGGDVTAAVLAELGALGMEIDREIVPLAVGGRIVGGTASGLPIVTKGGLIGDAGTGVLCLDHLIQAAGKKSA
ncbi:MAG: four-carbon acid sugar kinase family protein [Brevibacterium sp.]|nr:four-carbon acid sugar kinase family protein [Brevibacterium sp.]MDN6158585.1 four-carbon acid sugar kinase family protein [Brevibacterium sp.]MDN6667200.1 four-carbon acid sugar kinase family protein [Brevibacterium sp.]